MLLQNLCLAQDEAPKFDGSSCDPQLLPLEIVREKIRLSPTSSLIDFHFFVPFASTAQVTAHPLNALAHHLNSQLDPKHKNKIKVGWIEDSNQSETAYKIHQLEGLTYIVFRSKKIPTEVLALDLINMYKAIYQHVIQRSNAYLFFDFLAIDRGISGIHFRPNLNNTEFSGVELLAFLKAASRIIFSGSYLNYSNLPARNDIREFFNVHITDMQDLVYMLSIYSHRLTQMSIVLRNSLAKASKKKEVDKFLDGNFLEFQFEHSYIQELNSVEVGQKFANLVLDLKLELELGSLGNSELMSNPLSLLLGLTNLRLDYFEMMGKEIHKANVDFGSFVKKLSNPKTRLGVQDIMSLQEIAYQFDKLSNAVFATVVNQGENVSELGSELGSELKNDMRDILDLLVELQN